jgi:arylsulfatase A-like enzyme
MKFFNFIIILQILSSAIVFSASLKPNIVLIVADDLCVMDMTIEGSAFHETPNVDRIAKEGMRFSRGYATCQVCAPSRASIQTENYPVRFPITDWINS